MGPYCRGPRLGLQEVLGPGGAARSAAGPGPAYQRYFRAYCQWQLKKGPLASDLLRLKMESTKYQAERLKRQLVSRRDVQMDSGSPTRLHA